MSTLQKSNTIFNVRSISMPTTRPHPITLRVEEKLNELKNGEVSSTGEAICKNFSGLEDLYKCVYDLLNLPMTQQVISQHKHEKWVNELLDGSLRLLDTCGNTKDLVSQMKEKLGDARSCLRRRKGDSSIESSIAKFTSFRKKMKKDAKKIIASFKQVDSEIAVSQILNLDHHALAVIRALEEVSATSVSIFQSLLVFLSIPNWKPNKTKWSLVSNLMCKERVLCQDQVEKANELEKVDFALFNLSECNSSSEMERIQIAQNRMEVLEAFVEEFESCLECVFRHLIRTRASFLNIVSH